MAKISSRKGGAREDGENRPTIYVRRNGSRYIEPEELLQSEKFKKTLDELKGVTSDPRERPRK